MRIGFKTGMFYWLPPVAWAAGIFLLSSLSKPPAPPDFPYSDKVVHVLLFAVLALLLRRAFVHAGNLKTRSACWAAFALTILYGGFDEFHQAFVPHRSVEWLDWLADVMGAAASFLACHDRGKCPKDNGVYEQGGGTTPNQ
jgi:VanZ family protein